MSRGFVKEEDQEETPFIPPRAALPAGVQNYVTAEGMQELKKEQEELEEERANLKAENDAERRRLLAVINGKLALLNERINSARLVENMDEAKEEVRFGTVVKYKVIKGRNAGKEFEFRIVGVDEASIREKKMAFTAPLAKALMGKKVGERAKFSLAAEEQEVEVISLD